MYSSATKQPRHPRRRNRYGFSLIEASLATIIIGVGVTALIQLFVACTAQNRSGANMTTAMFLAQNVQEAIADLPFRDPSGAGFGLEESGGLAAYDDVDDFNGWTSAGGSPIDSTRATLPELSRYAQSVTVDRVNSNQVSQTLASDDAVRITVRVLFTPSGGSAAEIYRLSWLRMRSP